MVAVDPAPFLVSVFGTENYSRLGVPAFILDAEMNEPGHIHNKYLLVCWIWYMVGHMRHEIDDFLRIRCLSKC